MTFEPAPLPVPPLTAVEVEHYRWLLGGLLDGAFALAVQLAPDFSALPDALDVARDLTDELMARLAPVEDAR